MIDMPLGSILGALAWTEIGFCAMAAGRLDDASEMSHKGLTVPSAFKNLARPQLLFGKASVALARGNPQEASSLVEDEELRSLYVENATGKLG